MGDRRSFNRNQGSGWSTTEEDKSTDRSRSSERRVRFQNSKKKTSGGGRDARRSRRSLIPQRYTQKIRSSASRSTSKSQYSACRDSRRIPPPPQCSASSTSSRQSVEEPVVSDVFASDLKRCHKKLAKAVRILNGLVKQLNQTQRCSGGAPLKKVASSSATSDSSAVSTPRKKKMASPVRPSIVNRSRSSPRRKHSFSENKSSPRDAKKQVQRDYSGGAPLNGDYDSATTDSLAVSIPRKSTARPFVAGSSRSSDKKSSPNRVQENRNASYLAAPRNFQRPYNMVKGISWHWQQQHPKWETGRYDINKAKEDDDGFYQAKAAHSSSFKADISMPNKDASNSEKKKMRRKASYGTSLLPDRKKRSHHDY